MTLSSMHANSSNKKSANSLPRHFAAANNNAPDFLYKHPRFLNTEKRGVLGMESGAYCFYGTRNTAKQQNASVTQALIMHTSICQHEKMPRVLISS